MAGEKKDEKASTEEVLQKWCQRFTGEGGGYRMMIKEYEGIRAAPNPPFCEAFQKFAELNRYANINLIDQTRVVVADGLKGDYIHANWVDGYNMKNAFILTQAPPEQAVKDYWRMIWLEKAQIIVCLTSLKEKGSIKADVFFPTTNETPFRAGPLRLLALSIKEIPGKRIAIIHLRVYCWYGKSGQERDVAMVFYGGWPDRAVPTDSSGFLDLILATESLRDAAAKTSRFPSSAEWRPPVVVNCSAGVGRSATFVACMVELERLRDSGLVDPQGTVRRLRSQRSGACQNYVQYTFIARIILEAARRFPYPKDGKPPNSRNK